MLNGNLLRKIFLSTFFFLLLSLIIFPKNVFADGRIYLPGYPLDPPYWNAPGGWGTSMGHGFSAQPSLKCGGSIFLRWQAGETSPYYNYYGPYNPADNIYGCYDAGYVGSSHVTGCFMHEPTTYYNVYEQIDAYNQILVVGNYGGTSYNYTPVDTGSGPDSSSDLRTNPFWYNYSHDYFNNIMYYDGTYRYTGDVTNSAADPRNYSGRYNFTIQSCNSYGCSPNFVASDAYPGYWGEIYSSPTTVSSACTPNPPYKLNADVSVKQCGAIDISWQKIPEFLSGKSPMTAWKIYRANVYSPSGPTQTVCEDSNYSVYDSRHWYSCPQQIDTSIPYGLGRNDHGVYNYSFNNRIGTGEVPGNYTLVDTISSDATSYTDATAYPYPGDLPTGQTFLGYKYKVVAVNSFGESPDNLIGYNSYYGNTSWYQYGWYDVYSSAKDWWPYFYGDNLATPSLPDPSSGAYVYIYTKGAVKSSGSCAPNGPAYLTALPSRSQCGGVIDVSWENIPEFLSGKTPVTEWRVYRAPVYYHYPNSSDTTVYGEYSLIVTLPPNSTSTSYFYSDKKTLPYPTDTLQGQPFYGYNYKVVAVNSFGESTETLAATDLPDYYFSWNSWNPFHYYTVNRVGYSNYEGNYGVYGDYKIIYSQSIAGFWLGATQGSTNACAPTGVKVAAGPLCGQMTVSWDPTPLANYYNVLGKYTSPYYYTTGYYLPATSTSYIDDLKNHSDSTTNPYKASSVSYKVQVNWDATSPAFSGTSTACVLPTPTNVSATAAWSCGGGINLSWDSVSYADYYTITRATSASGVYSVVGTTTQVGNYWSPYNDKTVDPDTTYYYKISAHSDAGDSVFSTSTSAVSPSACPPHLNAQTSLQCGGKIDLSWSVVPQAAGYRIQKTSDWWGDGWIDILNTTSTSTVDTLTPYSYGYYRMVPYDSEGNDLIPTDPQWGYASEPCPPSCVDQSTLGVDSSRFYYIKPQTDTSNNFVLDIQSGDWNNSGTDDYSIAQLWSKTGADNQKWSIVPTGDGNYFNIISKNSNKSLDGGWGMYSNIFQISSNLNSNSQKWCFTGSANGGYGIVNKSTVQAADSYSDWYGFSDGNQIYSNDWYGSFGQLWKVEDENPINISCDSADKGSFDSAPTSGLCSDGSLPTVTTTPTSFEWYCGVNFCSAQKTLVDPCPGQVSCTIDGIQMCKDAIVQCPNDDHAIPSCCNTCYVGYSYNGTKCVKNPDIIFRSNPGYVPKNTSCKIEYNINDAASTTCTIIGLGVNNVVDLSSGSASSSFQTPQISTTTPYTLHCTRDTPGDPRPEIDKQTMCRVLKVREF